MYQRYFKSKTHSCKAGGTSTGKLQENHIVNIEFENLFQYFLRMEKQSVKKSSLQHVESHLS